MAGLRVSRYQWSDRFALLDAGELAGTLDTPANRTLVVRDAGAVGWVTWTFPGMIDPALPTLGGIVLTKPGRRDLFNALLFGACQDALHAGHQFGQAKVKPAILKLLRDDFIMEARVAATLGTGKGVAHYDITFDLFRNRLGLDAGGTIEVI